MAADKQQNIKTSKSEGKPRQIWRPKPLKDKSASVECPYCGVAVKPTYVICPHCGHSLTPGKCSFCGAPMKPTAKFCTKCGQTKDGVTCPACGTLNSRNFCRKCNAPLTPMAQKALEAAQNDPAFKAVQAKARELAELHEQIESLKNTQPPVRLSEADKALLDEYADVLGAIGATTPRPAPRMADPTPSRPQYEEKCMNLDDIMDAYRQKAEEMNAALAALTPPPDFTPEQQRDYYSARKVLNTEYTYTTHVDMSGYSPSVWCCNYCGCLHNCPSECAEPQLGGTWIYVSPEEYIEQNSTVTVDVSYKLVDAK
ncbi:MAG: zinc ribbon domain-containing protein [Muribaculaceae bacterium]|nr:zinc ribbon domain-containing protein [Muribaculaceae bacterium]